MIPTPPAEYDGPWKSAIELHLELFMEFFFPRLHARIDWQKGYESLKTELQPETADSETGVLLSDQAFSIRSRGDSHGIVCFSRCSITAIVNSSSNSGVKDIIQSIKRK